MMLVSTAKEMYFLGYWKERVLEFIFKSKASKYRLSKITFVFSAITGCCSIKLFQVVSIHV